MKIHYRDPGNASITCKPRGATVRTVSDYRTVDCKNCLNKLLAVSLSNIEMTKEELADEERWKAILEERLAFLDGPKLTI